MHKNLRLAAVTMYLAISGIPLIAGNPDAVPRSCDAAVTPVAGESWLNHLHRRFGETSMGKTGRLGPPDNGEQVPRWQLGLLSPAPSARLTGKDLYRLNCQGCHGEAGQGAPPEIHSVIDPARATSATLLIQRMRDRGMDISPATASQMAKQAQTALLERLHKGGQDMPAFPQLGEAEVSAVVGYVKQLSGVPAAKQLTAPETPLRTGELIAKSTCHVCHDASGPNPTPAQLEDGAIPPLDTLTSRTDESQFVRKVTEGAPVMMGTPSTSHRGRMPVSFTTCRAQEAADVYLYLSNYPPSLREASTPAVAAVQQNSDGQDPPISGPGSSTVLPSAPAVSDPPLSRHIPDSVVMLSMFGVGGLVMMLLTAGLGFAAYELRRLGRDGDKRQLRSILISASDRTLANWWRREKKFSLPSVEASELKGDVSCFHGCVK